MITMTEFKILPLINELIRPVSPWYIRMRTAIIRNILRELRSEGYITDNLGKCLDIGAEYGQGCAALKKEGAKEAYAIDFNISALYRGLEEGLIDEKHMVPVEMENLERAFNEGLLGRGKFDTAASFSFPYLNQKRDDLTPYAERTVSEILSLIENEVLGRTRTPEEREKDTLEKIPPAVESIVSVMKPSGTLIITGSYDDFVPEVFTNSGLDCKVHEVKSSNALEDVAYIGKRKR